MNIENELILTIKVNLGENIVVGNTNEGFLKVIPILGGTFFGKDINGTIVEGGADWNIKYSDSGSFVSAKYVLKTDDDVYIVIKNEGTINKKNEEQLIKTVPIFQVDKESKYNWLLDNVYVGSIDTTDDKYKININIYKLK